MSPITIGRHLLDPFRVFDNLLHSNNNKVTSSASKSLDTNTLKIGAGSVEITASAWHAGGVGSVPNAAGMFGIQPGSRRWERCIPRESENHLNVGPVSIYDVKEPLRTTSTLVVTTLSASIERSAWRKYSEKRLTSSIRPHTTIQQNNPAECWKQLELEQSKPSLVQHFSERSH